MTFPLLIEGLSAIDPLDHLVWIVIAAFLGVTVLDAVDRPDLARPVGGAAWALFGLFWLAMFPYFYYEVRSPLEAILSLAGLPLCAYTGYLLATGRDSLLTLSRAVAFMGLIYMPAYAITPIQRVLVETVAVQTHWGMELLGYSPGIVEGENGFRSKFGWADYTADHYSVYIVLACTGIGSISIFGGLIAAVRAPLVRKVKAAALAVGIIWVLNLARNVFVGLAAPLGWFDYPALHTLTALLAGESMRTSFFVSHHLIAQTLSVFALIGITLLVVRILPELFDVIDDVLFVLTGTEYDLREELGPATVRADGGDD